MSASYHRKRSVVNIAPARIFSLTEREERIRFVAVSLTYIALNLVVLFVVPFAWVVLIEAFG